MAWKINLTDQLKKYFGFDNFKGNQEPVGISTKVSLPSSKLFMIASCYPHRTEKLYHQAVHQTV